MPDATPLATVTNVYSYDYESGNAAPIAGQLLQHTTLSTITINKTDKGGTDRTAFLTTLNNTGWLIINGVQFNILTASTATGITTLTVSPPIAATPYGVQNITFVLPDASTAVGGALKPPVYPPPTAGNPVGVPTFPPPTPPPIGTVPAGPLVGPAVAPAGVPPSTAGFPLLRYATGSATVPAANGYFPLFTTTSAYAGFPNQPPTGVPIVFANVWTIPTLSGGVWTTHPPASTATTGQIILNGWGLPGPSGLGPGPPGYPNPPGAGLPHLASADDPVVTAPPIPVPDALYLYAGTSRRKRRVSPQSAA